MSTKPENTFITGVHKHLARSVYRMKTHNPYIAGVPDCYYSGSKSELWVEYKYISKLPVRVKVAVAVSALQEEWLAGRKAEGRHVAIIVGCPDGGVIMEVGEPLSIDVKEFNARTVSRAEIARWIEGVTL